MEVRKYFGAATLVASMFVGALDAYAEGLPFANRPRTGKWQLGSGIGFTLDPDTFLMGFDAGYFLTRNVAIGGLLEMGVDDNILLLAPSFNVRGIFDLPTQGFGRRVKPFVQGGFGLAFVTVDAPPGIDETDVGPLLNFGFGSDISLTDEWSLGTGMLFNILPVRLFRDRFYFSWEFIKVRYTF